jgi:hypothetical protein
MVGGSLRVLRLLPSLKLVVNIAESGVKHQKSNQIDIRILITPMFSSNSSYKIEFEWMIPPV